MRNFAEPYRKSRLQRVLLLAMALAVGSSKPLVRAQMDLEGLNMRADRGDPEALNTLGNVYVNGQGVPQDLTQALRGYSRIFVGLRGKAPGARFASGLTASEG